MTPADFASLSNNAIAFASVVYVLALLSHVAEWASGRSVPAEGAESLVAAETSAAAEQRVAVGAAVDGAPADGTADGTTYDDRRRPAMTRPLRHQPPGATTWPPRPTTSRSSAGSPWP